MKEPIFARTRYNYDSYTDYWKLVELSGFRTCYVDQIDLEQDEFYIVSPINGELRPHVTYRRSILKGPQKARIIWWNLERPDSHDRPFARESVVGPNNEILQYVDRIWVSDTLYHSLDPRMQFVILGSNPWLRTADGEPPTYDFTVMAYLNPRRTTVLSGLTAFRMGPNAWEPQRGKILSSSKVMLNIHQTEAPICEPLRFALAAAYKMPIISETCADAFPLKNGISILMADYNRLAGYASEMMRKDLSWHGERLHEELCSRWTFRTGVIKAMEIIS